MGTVRKAEVLFIFMNISLFVFVRNSVTPFLSLICRNVIVDRIPTWPLMIVLPVLRSTRVTLMGVEFELIFGNIEHIVGRLVSPSDAREILSAWEERKGGELDLGAVLGDRVGPVLYAALERWHRLAIADPIRYVEFDRNRAVLNRFTCGLASSTAMGVATAPAAAMSSWAAAIAISGGLGGRHLGGR